jgi:molecular chaperone DnaK (HSP70)
MDCVGIDIGGQSCLVSVPKAGGIEVLLNDYSQRQTPSVVSFGERMRAMGEDGKQKMVTQYKNTVSFFKQFIGRQYSSPDVQDALKQVFF